MLLHTNRSVVRTSYNTIRQMSVCMSGRATIQSGRNRCVRTGVKHDTTTTTTRYCTAQTGRRGFESLEGSVLDEAQYNQAYEVMNELHTINPDR